VEKDVGIKIYLKRMILKSIQAHVKLFLRKLNKTKNDHIYYYIFFIYHIIVAALSSL
jgi:hypothetical protein